MKGTSNELDTRMILQHLQETREREFSRAYGPVGLLYKTSTTCTGFMGSNPNDQLRFAEENGLFPLLVGQETDDVG